MRTAAAPPAPPPTSDLIVSLGDENPFLFAGLLSTKLGSSLYTKPRRLVSQSHTYTQQNVNGAAYHRGGGLREIVAERFFLNPAGVM